MGVCREKGGEVVCEQFKCSVGLPEWEEEE